MRCAVAAVTLVLAGCSLEPEWRPARIWTPLGGGDVIAAPTHVATGESFTVRMSTPGGCGDRVRTDVSYPDDETALVEPLIASGDCKLQILIYHEHAAVLVFDTPGEKTIIVRAAGNYETGEVFDTRVSVLVE